MNILEIGIEKGRNEGKIEGKVEAILDLLDVKGEVPEDLRSRVLAQKDDKVLRDWLILAAKVQEVSEFESKMD